MGIINNFLKKIGFKQKQELLPSNNNSEKISSSDTKESDSAAEVFNKSLRVNINDTSELIEESPSNISDYEQRKEPVLKVFAERGIYSTKIDYVVELETEEGNLIPIGIIKEKAEGISLKEIVGEISKVIGSIQTDSDKDDVSKRQEQLKEKMKDLNEKYKVNFTRSMINMVENSSIGSGINYRNFDSSLPKTVDISSLTPEQIVQYGKVLTKRLGILDSIKTPEDAYKAKVSLEAFMKSQETQTANSAIIAANLENLEGTEQVLDVPTIIAFAKKLETVSNEDGMLYSSYLKLEENRIIRKMQKEISTYGQQSENSAENSATITSLLEYLESTKTTTGEDSKGNITSYMIDTLQGNGIENYAKKLVKNDIRLKVFLQHNPIEHQAEALDYVVTKMACFGQVVATPESEEYEEKIRKLRDFIEVTDYKDEDDSESKNFLYTVVQIERDYIKKNYSPILREFQKIVEEQSK